MCPSAAVSAISRADQGPTRVLLIAVVSGWSSAALGETIEDEFSGLKAQVSSLESVYLAGVRREQGNRFESRMNDGQLFFYSKAYDRAAMIFLDLVDTEGNQGRAGYGDAVFFSLNPYFRLAIGPVLSGTSQH